MTDGTGVTDGPVPDILVVDDSVANVQLLGTLLEGRGYGVRVALNGRIALRAARSRAPDLVLLDINMPEMDGFAVCRALREDETLREVPVIFISAAVETADKLRAFREGGRDYVTKPFQAEEVLARVDAHLALARQRAELAEKNRALTQALEDLRKAQARMVQTEKMAALGLLTAGIAHELNNPLNFVAGSVQGIRKTLAPVEELLASCSRVAAGEGAPLPAPLVEWLSANDPVELRETLDELARNAVHGVDRAAEIVQGLRIFSRLDHGDRKFANIHENLNAAILLLHHRTRDGIRVERQYGDIPPWECFPGRLNQVFMNLLANAVDAIRARPGASGTISIRTSLEKREGRSCAVVEIGDTGTGMTEEVRRHLFEPFFTTKDVGRGVGLGLAISDGIVREHGGEIEVESAPGKGSVFRIVLPQSGAGPRGGTP